MKNAAAELFASHLLSLSAAEWAQIGARFLAEVDDERGTVDVAQEIERSGLAAEVERLAERVGPHVMRMESVERVGLDGASPDAEWPEEAEALRSVALHAAVTALGALLVRDRLPPGALGRIFHAFEPAIPLRELIGKEAAAEQFKPPPVDDAQAAAPPAAGGSLFGPLARSTTAEDARADALAANAFVARLEAPGDEPWLGATALCLDQFSLVERLDGQVALPAGLTYDALADAASRHLDLAGARAGAGEELARLDERLAARARRVDWTPLSKLAAYSGVSRSEMTRLAARAAWMAAAGLRLRSWLAPRAVEIAYAPFERVVPLDGGA
ncbi:MAG TPA: hypothetical protein VKA84_21175 [Gemmatimonadaceae bacterium]|nr:hypothetical protein [Gemmatimonadaceae bacterium]